MSYRNFIYDTHEGVARITIDRPASLNALDLESMEELCDIVNRSSSDHAVRVVLITGSGDKAFCAGGDVAYFANHAETAEIDFKVMTGYLHMAVFRLARMDAPVVAAVNGVAAGAGLSLVAASDLSIAVESATFASAYTNIGLTPDGSSTWYLPRLIGERRAMELYLTPRRLSADEAMDWGLINRVVSRDDFATAVESLAAQLAAGATQAYSAVKKLLKLSSNDTLESQMERESRTIARMAASPDGREGIRAFAEKRRPKFRGISLSTDSADF